MSEKKICRQILCKDCKKSFYVDSEAKSLNQLITEGQIEPNHIWNLNFPSIMKYDLQCKTEDDN